MGGSQSLENPDAKSKPCVCCASGTIHVAEEATPKLKVKKEKKKNKPRKKKKGRSRRKEPPSRGAMQLPKNRQRACPKKHPLQRFKTTQSGWTCDDCQGTKQKASIMFRCERCDYDLCRGCHNKVVFKKLELHDELTDKTPNPSYCKSMESIIVRRGEALTSVQAEVKWKYQDDHHGEQRICLRLIRDGVEGDLSTCDIFGSATNWIQFMNLDQSNAVFAEQILSKEKPGDKLSVGYSVAEGQDQEQQFESFVLYAGFLVSIADLEANCASHHVKKFSTDLEGWECDACLNKLPMMSIMYGCRKCDVDFCGDCRKKLSIQDLREIPLPMGNKILTDQPQKDPMKDTLTEISASHVETEIESEI